MKRKLVGFGLAFALAELAAAYLPPLASLLTAAGFVIAFIFFGSAPGTKKTGRKYLPVLLGGAAGLCWNLVFCQAVVRPAQALAGTTAECTAIVQTDCETSWQEGCLRGTLVLTEIEGRKTSLRVTCNAFPYAEPGEKFTARFRLSDLPESRYRMSDFSDSIWLEAEYLDGWNKVGSSNALQFSLYRLRQKLTRRLSHYLPRDLAGLEAAMLLGNKRLLRKDLSKTFRTAGISHLLAVSGLHVSLFCSLFAFGKKRSFSRPILAAQAAALLFYMALTGFPVSVVRAGTVFLIALAGYAMLQPPDALTSLGAAAVLIGIQPFAPCDVGFQLSFCGVLGVQAAAELSRRERNFFLHRAQADELPWLTEKLLALLGTVQAAFLASLATLPILLAHDMTTSGVAVLSNLLVVWMLGPALCIGLLVLLFSFVPLLNPLYHGISFVLSAWLKIMVDLAEFCADLPLARISLPQKYTLFALAVLAVLAIIFYHAGKIRLYIPTASVCACAAVAFGVWMQKDVVQIALVGTSGNPCVVVMQNARAAVIFRGGAANSNAVTEYLSAHGAGDPVALIDLRTDPQQQTPDADEYWNMEELPDGCTRIDLLDTLAVDLYHDSGGNLAVLDVGGYHVAAAAGEISLIRPVTVDLFLAAGGYPEYVEAQSIMTNQKNPKWKKTLDTENFYIGTDTPSVTVRPGRSVVFEEVQELALQ
ncbi:MAG: ComEC/Rec2 family competence protein [Gemmiger sp.]